MKIIKEHVKNGTYKPVYLLYGAEEYLKKLYRDKLKEGIMGDGDSMNFSYFEGKNLDVNEFIHIAETMPFFSERRMILVENSGLFKAQSELADYMKEMPETTHVVFVEQEVDKRNRLFKAVKDIGYICELNGLDDSQIKLWAAGILNKDKKKITDATMNYLLDKVGKDMVNLKTELEKLICYAYEKEVITAEDIDAICTEQLTGKIFLMIDAIAAGNEKRALELYYDLLSLKEKPMSILYLIIRHFNILLQVKDLSKRSVNNQGIAAKVGVPPFAVAKYISQARTFKQDAIKNNIAYGIEIEEQVKSGRLNEQIGVELMIVKTSTTSN